MLTERLDSLLTKRMAEADLDLGLVINRECAEDPVSFTLVAQPSFAARRTARNGAIHEPMCLSVHLRANSTWHSISRRARRSFQRSHNSHLVSLSS
jgi:hypothetical protein